MPARAELTLAALGLIHHCSAKSLYELASARGVTPDESWNVYTLAKALIEPGAVWHQLSHLGRSTLLVVDELRQKRGQATVELPWGVADPNGDGLRPEVTHAVDTFSSEWEASMAQPGPPAPHTSMTSAPDQAEALRQTLPRIIDALDELELAITLVAYNDISQRTPSGPLLAKALGHLDPEVSADWDEAADWGIWSGFLVHHGGSWWVSDAALDFVAAEHSAQLATLANLWWARCDNAVQAELARALADQFPPTSLANYARTYFPLLDASTLSNFFERGHRLGALSGHRGTALLGYLIEGKNLADAVEPLLPQPAPGVYLDSVDSVVGAGPLSRDHREKLGLVARCVRAGMTPRWVIDRDVVLRSLSAMSAGDLCDQLGAVIIGGVPESLRHQIHDWESRAQSLVLSPDFPGTVLRCADHYLSELLLVDQKLNTLHLARTDDTILMSQRDIGQTRRVLLDSGYPTLPGDVTAPSPRVRTTPQATPLPESWWVNIIASANDMPRNAVWTEDVLRDAIAERTLLALAVRVGDTERHMVVEPRSIAGGRLRVKDTAVDVERTLPLDTIVSINPAQRPLTKNA